MHLTPLKKVSPLGEKLNLWQEICHAGWVQFDIKKADEYNKKPPLFKKLFNAGSVEEEVYANLWKSGG